MRTVNLRVVWPSPFVRGVAIAIRAHDTPAHACVPTSHRPSPQYTFGDLQPTYPGEFCMYEECDGWDPDAGMPVTQFHTASNGHTPPDPGMCAGVY